MTTVRFGLAVDSDNGHHVRFRLFSATGGEHLGGCGQLVMRPAEYATFRQLLEPALSDRGDPSLTEQVRFVGTSTSEARPGGVCDGAGSNIVGDADDVGTFECGVCDGTGLAR